MRLRALTAVLLFVVVGTHAAEPFPDDGKQARRMKVIRELVDRGIWARVDKGTSPGSAILYVRPAFYALDFKDKEAFVRVLASHAAVRCQCDPAWEVFVILRDVRTNKKIGKFTFISGLELE